MDDPKNKDDNTRTLPKFPTQPHPAVKAFTNALTITLRETNTAANSKEDHKNNDIKKKVNSSNLIEKVSQTLGWRNRHSQSEYYPLEIQYNETIETNDNDNATCVKLTETTLQIKQVQRGEIENTYGTGATVWPASVVLVKYLEHIFLKQQSEGRSDIIHGNINRSRKVTIADLGSGTGVTSIATAFYLGMLNSCHENVDKGSFIVCTDGSDSVVELARENIEKTIQSMSSQGMKFNDIDPSIIVENHRDKVYSIGQSQIKVRKYLWGDGTLLSELKIITDSKVGKDNYFDFVLVSDCVLPRLYPIDPLVKAIDELSGPNTVTIVSYEYRYYPEYDPKEFFVQAAKARGLEVETIPISEQHPIYSVDDIEIWVVRRKKN